MFFYKISFLIVLMLSVVCFSADNSDEASRIDSERSEESEEEKRLKGLQECSNAMLAVFGRSRSAPNCISNAFKFMKLCGTDAYQYNEYVKMYYQWFEFYTSYEKIKLPDEFCESYKNPYQQTDEFKISCFNQLLIFVETPFHEQIQMPNQSLSSNQGQSEQSSREIILPSGESSSREIIYANGGPPAIKMAPPKKIMKKKQKVQLPKRPYITFTNRGTLKRNVLINALYYHVMYTPNNDFVPSQEARKYFHENQTFGYDYLAEVARVIILNQGIKVYYPYQFCLILFEPPTENIQENVININ